MKYKCCNKILIPKISYKASLIDSIGFIILLSFFMGIVMLIAYVASFSLVESIASGDAFECQDSYIRHCAPSGLHFGLFVFFGIYKLLPKFINACSFLVNYKFKGIIKCNVCGKESVAFDYPKNDSPF